MKPQPSVKRVAAWCARPAVLGGPCGWRQAGPADVVDLEARRHTGEDRLRGGPRPGHPTTTALAEWES